MVESMKALCKLDAVELSVRHAIAVRERNEARAFSPCVQPDEPNASFAARRSFTKKQTRLAMEVMRDRRVFFFEAFFVRAS